MHTGAFAAFPENPKQVGLGSPPVGRVGVGQFGGYLSQTTLQPFDTYKLTVVAAMTPPATATNPTPTPAIFPINASILPSELHAGLGLIGSPDANGNVTISGIYQGSQPFTVPLALPMVIPVINTTLYFPVYVTITGNARLNGLRNCPPSTVPNPFGPPWCCPEGTVPMPGGQCFAPKGSANTGIANTGKNTGGQNTGGQNTGGQNTGGQNTGSAAPSTGMSTGTMVAIGVVAVGAIGGAAWWYMQKRKHVALPAARRASPASELLFQNPFQMQGFEEATPNPRLRRRIRRTR